MPTNDSKDPIMHELLQQVRDANASIQQLQQKVKALETKRTLKVKGDDDVKIFEAFINENLVQPTKGKILDYLKSNHQINILRRKHQQVTQQMIEANEDKRKEVQAFFQFMLTTTKIDEVVLKSLWANKCHNLPYRYSNEDQKIRQRRVTKCVR